MVVDPTLDDSGAFCCCCVSSTARTIAEDRFSLAVAPNSNVFILGVVVQHMGLLSSDVVAVMVFRMSPTQR